MLIRLEFALLVLALTACQAADTPAGAPSGDPTPQASSAVPDLGLEELLARYREASGRGRLASLGSLRQSGEITGVGMKDDPVVLEKKAGGLYRREIRIPDGSLIDGVGPDGPWRKLPTQASGAPVEGERAEQLRVTAALADPLLNAAEAGHQVALAAKEAADGRDRYRLDVRFAQGGEARFFVDAESFLVTRMTYQGTLRGSRVEIETLYEDQREVDGIQLAFTERIRAPNFEQVIQWKNVELDPELDDSIFAMP